MIKLSFESKFDVEKKVLVDHSFSMKGVNAELFPWLRLTYPAGILRENVEAPGRFFFHSWVLFLGFIPIDYYSFYFTSYNIDGHFYENSSSLTYKNWCHIREVSETEGGCTLKDELEIKPHLIFLSPLIRFFVRRLFIHRHRVLKKKFNKV